MALISLRRNFCHLSDFWIPGVVAALKAPPRANHIHKVVRDHLYLWFDSLQPELLQVRFHHAYCKSFHSENGHDLHPVGEPSFSPVHEEDPVEQSLQNQNEQVFHRRLNNFTSAQEVLGFLSTLETLPDTLAVGALQRICEVEKRAGSQEILGDSAFQALCSRFEQEPSHLSNAVLMTALQSLIVLRVDPQSSLVLNLVAECQNRMKRGSLEVHHLFVLGESLVQLQGPGRETLELIIYRLQGEKLEAFTPEDIVTIYRILQACPEKVEQHQKFLNTINSFSPSVVSYLSPKSVSQMLTALVVLDQTQALPLVLKLGKYVVRHIPRFTHEELRKVLEAFVYLGHTDRFLVRALEQHVSALCLTLDPEVACTVTDYCSRKQILSKPILNTVAEIFICQSEKLSPSQIADLIEPFGKLNYLPPNAPVLFRKLESVLFARFNSFPPKTLLRLLHSCALVEHHPVNFMSKLFSPFFLQRLQGEESYLDPLSLAQLTQLFLTSVLECPFYKGPKLLSKYRVKSFFTPCCSLETPVDFHLYKSVVIGLMDLLGSRLCFASKVLTPCCYTIASAHL
ncbi:FAST kinase domain-containing protein 3, mitochondrial isoform X2 [Nannospalax galili]|uniref:FAST kinase domain-containing protein 3, mitochondrial isoform X2 n=1 Tax=Nannospalax galili TaxID=1026970 RepID=UPI00111C6FDB|nr:FAST kinase domain-containing protein 3, mitochondrial isoform X2 [Nannospalax galili]